MERRGLLIRCDDAHSSLSLAAAGFARLSHLLCCSLLCGKGRVCSVQGKHPKRGRERGE